MSIIEATSGTYRSRVDGTIVLSVEISPIHAKEALELFGMPGTSIALAALKDGHAAVSDKRTGDNLDVIQGRHFVVGIPELPISDKPGQGPLCKWLVLRCKEPQFWEWMMGSPNGLNEQSATNRVKDILGIESRKELDGDQHLEDKFHKLIRIPYSKWLERRK
jgi:hypothetical protein